MLRGASKPASLKSMPTRVLFLSLALVLSSGILAYSSKSSFQASTKKDVGMVYGDSTSFLNNLPPEIRLPVDTKVVSTSAGKGGSQITFETNEGRLSVKSLVEGSLISAGWEKNNEEKLTKANLSLSIQVTPQDSSNPTIVTISYLTGR